jgi:hypothetical protein
MWTFSEFMVALLDKLSSCWINKKDLDKGIRYEARSVLCDLYLLSLDRLENRSRIKVVFPTWSFYRAMYVINTVPINLKCEF